MTEESKPEIVKVQLPMPSGAGLALVYAEDRARQSLIGISKAARKVVLRKYKAFFYARWDGKRWHIGDEAPWQEW